MHDPCNAKEHYQLFIFNKKRKSVKELEIFTYQTKIFQNPENAAIKSVITEHRNTRH